MAKYWTPRRLYRLLIKYKDQRPKAQRYLFPFCIHSIFCICSYVYASCTLVITWWRHQMETFSVALCAGNSPPKGQWHGALMFSLICARINGWVNNCEAGDLRRYRAHYDVTVMNINVCSNRPVPFAIIMKTSWHEKTFRMTIVRLVIWDAIVPIMTSL